MVDIGYNTVCERKCDIDVVRRFFIHCKSVITVRKQITSVLNGDHIFVRHYMVRESVIYFDVIGTKIYTESIDGQNDFLVYILYLAYFTIMVARCIYQLFSHHTASEAM